MRTRFAALTAIVLAATVTLLTGCSKATSNSTNTTANTVNTVNNANTASTPSASPAATTTSSASPTTGDSGSSPTDALIAYIDAIKRKDAAAVKNLFSKSVLNEMEAEAKKRNKTVEAVIQEGLEEISKDVPEGTPKTRNEKIEGDKATLELRDEKQDKWELVNLVREDGQWKIFFDNEKH